MKNNGKTAAKKKSKIDGDIDLLVTLTDRASRGEQKIRELVNRAAIYEGAYEQVRKTLAVVLFERNILAKLAADGPAFTSPFEVIVARAVRDAVLVKALGLSSNGSSLN
jgi:hypothetical protein